MRPSRRELIGLAICIVLIVATTAVVAWPRHDRLVAELRRLNADGRYEQAISLGRRYEPRQSKYSDFLVALGTALHNARRYEEAAETYRQAIARDPQSTVAPKLLAQSLRALSRQADADAIRWLAEAATCDPTNDTIFLDLGRFAPLEELLATPSETAGKIVRAWESANRAHPSLRRNADVKQVVAQMALIVGHDELAESLWPVTGDALATRRVYQAQRSLAAGDRAAATTFLREAAAVTPQRQDVASLLASLGQAKSVEYDMLLERAVPDGPFIVDPLRAQIYYAGLRAFDLTSGRQRELAERVIAFSVSTDGARIAYFAPAADGAELWLINADGSNARLLANAGAGGDAIAWATDNRRLAFTGGAGLSVINSDGSGLRTIVAGDEERGLPAAPAFAVDGRLAYALSLPEGSGGVTAITTSAHLAGFTTTQEYDRPRWSADGQWLLVDVVGYDLSLGQTVVVNANGQSLPVNQPAALIKAAAWARSGSRLAYIAEDPAPLDADSGAAATQPRRLWLRQWPAGVPLLVDVGPGDYDQPQWLTDGTLAFVVRDASGDQRLWIIRPR